MRPFLLVAALMLTTPALATEAVLLHAAGSLRGALTEVTEAFKAETGRTVTARFGASGLLRDAIMGGEKAEVFASANMEHPQALVKEGRAEAVQRFARNALCAFVRPGLEVTPASLLDRMLDPAIKLGTSTPRADPSGDYAFAVFAKAEALKAGAKAALEAKALQLTGGPTSAPPPAGRNVYGHMIASGQADLFLAYCTNGPILAREEPAIRLVTLPPELAVGADYGLTTLNGASEGARALAAFILSDKGQAVLARHGFSGK